MVVLRLSVAAARLGLMVLLYLLGRRLVPPPFALLPLLMLFVEDQLPGVWETPPGLVGDAGVGGGGLVRLPLS